MRLLKKGGLVRMMVRMMMCYEMMVPLLLVWMS